MAVQLHDGVVRLAGRVECELARVAQSVDWMRLLLDGIALWAVQYEDWILQVRLCLNLLPPLVVRWEHVVSASGSWFQYLPASFDPGTGHLNSDPLQTGLWLPSAPSPRPLTSGSP